MKVSFFTCKSLLYFYTHTFILFLLLLSYVLALKLARKTLKGRPVLHLHPYLLIIYNHCDTLWYIDTITVSRFNDRMLFVRHCRYYYYEEYNFITESYLVIWYCYYNKLMAKLLSILPMTMWIWQLRMIGSRGANQMRLKVVVRAGRQMVPPGGRRRCQTSSSAIFVLARPFVNRQCFHGLPYVVSCLSSRQSHLIIFISIDRGRAVAVVVQKWGFKCHGWRE